MFYKDLVDQSQNVYSNYYRYYAQGSTPYKLTNKGDIPYDEQIELFVKKVKEADCIVIGAASGLSSAGGGDFYYEDNESYRKYFGKYAEKYGFRGAFEGTFSKWESREEFWGYLATFLNTTQKAPLREPYVDLNEIISKKDFFVLTTNQDTQFTRIYSEDKLSQIQGDHRFFQCSKACTDEVWDAVRPVENLILALGDGTAVPTDMIPRCPHCGAEAFPWVRGYGNFLTGTKYKEEYQKISNYILKNKDKKILFIELGVGRMTPMFIQEPFWILTEKLKNAYYICVNMEYKFLPQFIEDKGIAIKENIAKVLKDVRNKL